MSHFAERLKSARKMKGWSLQDLADQLENRVSRQALHKYETGETSPEFDVLMLLCTQLGIRPEYFSRRAMPAIESPSFRKMVKLPKREQEKAVELTRDTLERYLQLEEVLDAKIAFVNQFAVGPIMERDQAISLAIQLRGQWKIGLDPIPDCTGLLEGNGIRVIEFDAHEDFNGMSIIVQAPSPVPVIVVNRALNAKLDRKRFTLCHELGHLFMDKLFPKDLPEKDRERLCDAFAGAFLLPGEKLTELLGAHRTAIHQHELVLIKELFGISLRAILYQAKNAGIITDYYLTGYMIRLNKEYGRKNEPGRYQGHEKPVRFRQLVYRAVSEEIISMGRAAELSGQPLHAFRDEMETI